jgi:hypothetical protein
VIDGHAHPFDLELRELELSRIAFDLSETERGGHGLPLLWRAVLLNRLATRLGVHAEDVEAARREAAAEYPRYVRALFADAGIDEIVMDPAWPPGSAERVAEFASVSGCRIHLLFRIEPVIDGLLEDGVAFEELLERFDRALELAAGRGVRGLKIAIAYRTGLGIDAAVTERTARLALSGIGPVRRRAKPLRDFLVRRTLGFAIDAGLPVQIHSGFGDSDLRLSETNPLGLEELLRTPEGSEATVVLLHAGYPYVDEAGYLATAHENVHVDFSLVPVVAPSRLVDVMHRLLAMAPAERLLAGTDGWSPPEAHWVAGVMLREAWEQVERQLTALGGPSGWLRDASYAVFEGNARRLYRPDDAT